AEHPSPFPAADLLLWSWQFSYKRPNELWSFPAYDLFHQYPMLYHEYMGPDILVQAMHNASAQCIMGHQVSGAVIVSDSAFAATPSPASPVRPWRPRESASSR